MSGQAALEHFLDHQSIQRFSFLAGLFSLGLGVAQFLKISLSQFVDLFHTSNNKLAKTCLGKQLRKLEMAQSSLKLACLAEIASPSPRG